MELFRKFTYWWVTINVVGGLLFSLVAIIFGGRDLFKLLGALLTAQTDETDDGRVT